MPKATGRPPPLSVKSNGSLRPNPVPLGSASSSRSASDNFLLTQSERNRKLAEETKRAAEQCFDFLLPDNIRDKDGHPPDHPQYDKRTIMIPKSSWKEFSPFEEQFWRIKQDHFDTVLFFQKGKFYELYEDDAMIGHQEFDLKLTDRVKMKMVSRTARLGIFVLNTSGGSSGAELRLVGIKIPRCRIQGRQSGASRDSYGVSFAFSVTSLTVRKEVRQKDKGKTGTNEDKIVRRELERVFTNGTIVDGAYLSTHEANHCVSIKEYTPTPHGASSFGICFADTSTGEVNLSFFQDDIIRTRLETLFRQIRPKEVIAAKASRILDSAREVQGLDLHG